MDASPSLMHATGGQFLVVADGNALYLGSGFQSSVAADHPVDNSAMETGRDCVCVSVCVSDTWTPENQTIKKRDMLWSIAIAWSVYTGC